MKIEYERKFLVAKPDVLDGLEGQAIRQAYLAQTDGLSIRVRLAGGRGILGLKANQAGIARLELEYEIPVPEALLLLERYAQGTPISKVRYKVPHAGHVWEVDKFLAANRGLILAEIELTKPDERPPLPCWLGVEVTDDIAYYNASLAAKPYATWAPTPA